MKKLELTLAGRIVVFILALAIIGGAAYVGYPYYSQFFAKKDNTSTATSPVGPDQNTTTNNQASPASGNNDGTSTPSAKPTSDTAASSPEINLSLDEWIGWKPIIDANQGLTTQPGSIFDKLGIKVNIKVINDGTASSNALITGELNAAGYTTNRTAFLSGKFKEAGLDVVMPVFTNYSAGGDGIIAKNNIKTVRDLIGKKIGVPRFSEAQTLVAWFVQKSDDLTDTEKADILNNMILFEDASATGEAFFANQLDVAATWQPYLSYAAEDADTHIMFSTTASKSLIMDGIVFRADFAKAYPDVISKFIDGIFQANELYTTEFDPIRAVMPMFADCSDQDIIDMSMDAELMGYAANKEVLDTTAPSVYSDMCNIWEYLGESVDKKAAMTLFDPTYLMTLAGKYSSAPVVTESVELTEDQKQEVINYTALLTKSMTVEFMPDMAAFKDPQEAYAIMDEFVAIAKTLDGAIIQVEGNINAVNYSDAGMSLSAERAKAVAKYFIASGIDPNRIITVGNGNTKMVADVNGSDAYLNRRTDVFFKIIEN